MCIVDEEHLYEIPDNEMASSKLPDNLDVILSHADSTDIHAGVFLKEKKQASTLYHLHSYFRTGNQLQ